MRIACIAIAVTALSASVASSQPIEFQQYVRLAVECASVQVNRGDCFHRVKDILSRQTRWQVEEIRAKNSQGADGEISVIAARHEYLVSIIDFNQAFPDVWKQLSPGVQVPQVPR